MTLKFCFESNSFNGLVDKIVKSNHEQININIYGNDLQNLINSLLNIDYKKRPTVEEILKIINKYFSQLFFDQIAELFQEDEVIQNYLIERNIEKSIDMMSFTTLSREAKFSKIKSYAGTLLVGIPLNFILGFFIGGISLIVVLGIGGVVGGSVGAIFGQIFNPEKILNLLKIMQLYSKKLIEKIKINLMKKY